MPRYSNDGWANLLAAVDYRNEAPEREMKREAAMLQLQALKDANQKRTALEAYRASLDNPQTPETTAQVPDMEASAQTDPNALYQEQPTKDVAIPATFLSEDQKLEKMERYHALNGNWQEAKQINEYRKQEHQRMGFHQTFIKAYQMAGMDGEKTRQLLIRHYGEGARPQLENLEFTPSGVIQKKEGILTDWDGKIHNLPKEATETSFNQGGMTDKGYSVGFQPKLNQWMVNIDGKNVPCNESTHGKIRPAKEPIHINVPVNMQYVGSTPEGAPVFFNPRTAE